MNQVDCIQGDPLWFAARAGSVTASRVAAVIAKLKRSSNESAERAHYRCQLVSERLTGRADEHYVSQYMKDGTENEPLARTAYELERDCMVEQVGFVLHPTIQWVGASPDGIVGSDGLLECKCPKATTHLEYLLGGVVPEEYQAQMLLQMAVCERQWCDFASYNPLFPEHLRLFIVRFPRDEKRIAEMEAEVVKFLGEVEMMLGSLPRKAGEDVLERQLEESLRITKQDVARVSL
jgi:putative phage-type endonuclease